MAPMVVFSAGQFDGQWKGYSFYESCKTPGDITVTVAGNKATGEYGRIYDRQGEAISGHVMPDGTFEGTIGHGPITGKFGADEFRGSYASSGCGKATVDLRRVK